MFVSYNLERPCCKFGVYEKINKNVPYGFYLMQKYNINRIFWEVINILESHNVLGLTFKF